MEIKGYNIHRKIGAGAMASVYLAEQESLGRQIALKVLAPALVGQRGFTSRFLNEGKIIAYLKHPQIVSVYDLGAYDQNYYLAMEFLSGGTLEQRIKTGLSATQCLRFTKQISTALSFAHQQGVIHRDVKSQNIMFGDDDVPILTDFGIARLMDSDTQLTIPGRTVGSPLYMSPEQICGDKIDTRSDLYSVGILLYKMLTQKLPYQSDQFVTIAVMHKTAPVPDLPEEFSAFQPVLNRLLAKKPDDRYATAQALIEDLIGIESDFSFPPGATEENSAVAWPLDSGSAVNHSAQSVTNSDRPKHIGTQPLFRVPPVTNGVGRKGLKGRVAHMKTNFRPLKNSAQVSSFLKFVATRKIGWVLTSVALSLAIGLYAADSFFGINFASLTQSPSGTPEVKKDAPLVNVRRKVELEHGKKQNQDLREPMAQRKEDSGNPSVVEEGKVAVGNSKAVAEKGKAAAENSKAYIRQQRMEALLAQAHEQLAEFKLRVPQGDNCYETYQQLLSIDPSGQIAKPILIKIGQAYSQLAREEKSKGKWQEGLNYAGKGVELLPQDPDLLALQAELRDHLDEHRRALAVEEEKAMKAKRRRERVAEMAAIEREKKKRAAEALEQQKRAAKELEQQKSNAEALEQQKRAAKELEQQKRNAKMLEERRKIEAERARLEAQTTEQPKVEEPKTNTEAETKTPAETEKEPGKKRRLFGTF